MTLPPVERHPSPNHGPRAHGKPVDILVLHYTGMVSERRAIDWLCHPASAVSSHYFVFEDGRIARLVDEEHRAWHAGLSTWAGETDINSRSIGIEIANPGHEFGYRAFPEAQVEATIALCCDILTRHPIPPQRVLAHSDVAPLRKDDPGELFPWQRLHEAGVGHWVAPSPIVAGDAIIRGDGGKAVAMLQDKLRAYGYAVRSNEYCEYDAETEAVVRAFQRHFRPARIDGIADPSTVDTLDRLVAALPAKG